ncbi:hypothetical protein ACOME3_004951 [Neoechinorhynchus agilis]
MIMKNSELPLNTTIFSLVFIVLSINIFLLASVIRYEPRLSLIRGRRFSLLSAQRGSILLDLMLRILEKVDLLRRDIAEVLLSEQNVLLRCSMRLQRNIYNQLPDKFEEYLNEMIIGDYVNSLVKQIYHEPITRTITQYRLAACKLICHDYSLFLSTLKFLLVKASSCSYGGLIGTVLSKLVCYSTDPWMANLFELLFSVQRMITHFIDHAETAQMLALLEKFDSSVECYFNQSMPFNEHIVLLLLSNPFAIHKMAFSLIDILWFPENSSIDTEPSEEAQIEYIEVRIEFLNLALKCFSSPILDLSLGKRLDAHAVRRMRSSLVEAIAAMRQSFTTHRDRKTLGESKFVQLMDEHLLFGLLWQHLLVYALKMLWIKITHFSVPYSLLRPLQLCSRLRTDRLWLHELAFCLCKRTAPEIVGHLARRDEDHLLPTPIVRMARIGFPNELRKLDQQVMFMAIQTMFAGPMIVNELSHEQTPRRHLIDAYEVLSSVLDDKEEDRISPNAFRPYIERLRPVGGERDTVARVAYERLKWKFARYAKNT